MLAFDSDENDTTAFLKLNKLTIEDASGLTFTDIRSLALNTEKHLFVVDSTYIHKFNIDAILTDNRAISGIGRFLMKTIGGKSGNIYDKDKFNKPVDISLDSNDNVYILDQDDLGFKLYDKDLNWKRTASRKTEFLKLSGGQPISIAVDKHTDDVYVLSNNGVVFQYDSQSRLMDTFYLTDPVASDETYKQIVFSRKNRDVVYVMTNKSVFKKFKSKIDKSIGAFRLINNNITDQTLSFVDIMLTDNVEFDYVFVGGESTHSGVWGSVSKVFKFNETINHQTLVYDSYKQDIYPLSAVNVTSDEYVTSFVINKSLHKLIYNHLLFRDNIFFKYEGAYDSIGRKEYTKARHLLDTDPNLFEYTTDLNNFLGINEPVFADTVNRPLRKLHDLQTRLLDMCKESITNKYPYPTQVVELK